MTHPTLTESIDRVISRRYPAPSLRLELQQVQNSPTEATKFFHRGLACFQKTSFNLRPFHELTPLEQSRVMENASLLQLGLVICDWADDEHDCQALATVHHVSSERDLCSRHYVMTEGK